MEEFRSQKCYSHMNNLQTTSRDTKDFPKVLRCVWINTNRQSVPVTPKARYFKKNLQHLLGAKWQRDLETQEELDKFLEIWCGDRINPCKKKLSGAEHTQRKFCVDFRAHEPGIFTFSPWKVCDFAKIEFGILKVFFLHGFYIQLGEVCTNFAGYASLLRSRCHFAPRWTAKIHYQNVIFLFISTILMRKIVNNKIPETLYTIYTLP